MPTKAIAWPAAETAWATTIGNPAASDAVGVRGAKAYDGCTPPATARRGRDANASCA